MKDSERRQLEKYRWLMDAAASDSEPKWREAYVVQARNTAFEEAHLSADVGASKRAERWQWRLAWASACHRWVNVDRGAPEVSA